VVTRMRFQLVPMYNIEGTEVCTPPTLDACPIDLFGAGEPGGKPSLQQYFTDQPYSRMTWYPQAGGERVQIWQASRVPTTNAGLNPYQQFPPDFFGQSKALGASLLFVLLGNTDHPRIMRLLQKNVKQYLLNLAQIWEMEPNLGWKMRGAELVGLLYLAVGWIVGYLPGTVQRLFPQLLNVFAPFTGYGPGEGTQFNDWYWRSLCMDNTADDVLLGTEFVEMWAPIQYTQQIMNLLQGMFTAKGAAATGWFAQEIYAAAPSPAWMNPSYSNGQDEYANGVSRFDVYWYRDNEGQPDAAHAFFEQYWNLLRTNNVPFRFHWGKFVPYYDFPGWAAYYRASLPMFERFMQLRAQRDPNNVFLTTYWSNVLLGGPPNG
jgi:hypothetical protein